MGIERSIIEAVRASPSADNSQPWQLTENESGLSLSYADRAADNSAFEPGDHGTLIAMGALVENIAQATSENFTAKILASSKADEPIALFELGVANRSRCERVLDRHTNRFPFAAKPVDPSILRRLAGSRENTARIVSLNPGQRFSVLVRLARRCAEARFLSRELHEWLINSLRFTPEQVARGDGLDVATLHLPPLGRHFLKFISPWHRMETLNRLGAYKFMAASEVVLLRAAPALVCIVGPSDRRAVLDAGRLMERSWIELNALGIAVHPYYVITDQLVRLRDGKLPTSQQASIRAVEEELRQLLELAPGEMLHMMLRIGYPKVAHPPRSQRLPLEAIFTDRTKV